MRVLIADDSATQRELLRGLVTRLGYEPEVVADGPPAIAALCAQDGPELALLDWLMPGADGLEVCRAVRASGRTPSPRLAIITGVDLVEIGPLALAAGANLVLAKPATPTELGRFLRGEHALDSAPTRDVA